VGTTIFPVQAYAVASTLAPKDAAELFDGQVTRLVLSKTIALFKYPGDGWAIAHDFGAIVFIQVPAEEQKRVMTKLLEKVGPEIRPPASEDFVIEVSPGATLAVHFEKLVVDAIDARVAEMVGLVVGQSVAMEYYEEDVDVLIGEMDKLSRALAAQGKFRGRARSILAFIGRCMATRSQVIHTLALLDAPAATWESESLDRLHRGLRATFAIEDRYRGLDHKLGMLQDNLEILADLTRHQRSLWLEVAVILLIAAELVLPFVQQLHRG
jgi:uncharacterized Rmd1/YagE family protein